MKFLSFKDRETVWNNKSKLRGTNIYVSEDFPPEITKERKILFPIFKKAQAMKDIQSAKLKVNKLYLNNREFSCKNLNELPKKLKQENLYTKRSNGVVLFCSRNSFLSNLYSEADIMIDGQKYSSTEQYFQQQKALFFNDDKSASAIMNETDPYKIMSHGYRIKGYDEAKWSLEQNKVLFKANIAKFTQVSAARDALLATGQDKLGEATKNKVFGIGMHLHEAAAVDSSNWGRNLFGQILEDVRTHITRETQNTVL